MNRRKRMMEDLDQDIRTHIEMETQDNIERGMSPEEARYSALRKFGNITRVREETWEVWSFPWLEELFIDLCYGVRTLRKSPGFAIVAILTLALGIGANTAIYSVIHGTLQLPFTNADRMVVIKNVYPRQSYFGISWPDFLVFRSSSKSFAEMAGLFTSRMTWRGGKTAEDLNIGLITEGYFRMYGMRPVLGRSFLASDHKQGSEPVCALGENFWREELQGNASVIGKPFSLDGKTCTIVGVMQKVIPDSNHPAQVWIPMEPNPPFRAHGSDFLLTVGLLRPGVSITQALAELRGIQSQENRKIG
jgi:putative ABC transport system permease protein